jgi:hypothetical protein
MSKELVGKDPSTGSTLRIRDGIYVLNLHGGPYDRGLAHGKLLQEQIMSSRMLKYYGNFITDLYQSSDFYKRIPGFSRKALGDLLEWWFYAPFEKLFLDETRQELNGLADAMGYDKKEVLRAVMAPDIMIHLAAGFLSGAKQGLGNYYLGGCSAVYARKTAIKNNRQALFARNMDFPGTLIWRNPVVIFSHPTEAVEVTVETEGGGFRKAIMKKQPYAYISVAGFPGHGLTGVNGSGVAMGSFVCLSKNIKRKGMLFLDFNHYLFTRVRSLKALVHLVETEGLRSASPHTVMFADEESAVTIEVDSSRSVVRPMTKGFDVHVQTNHFLNPLMKKREIEFPLEREHTIGRFRLLNDAIQENYGELDVRRITDVISCNFDTSSQTSRIVGDFPAQLNTLTSTVFEPNTGNFWVASGNPPAVCYNRYVGFNFHRDLLGLSPELPQISRSNTPVFRGTVHEPVTECMKRSMRLFMLSQDQLNKGKVRKALRSVEKAIRLYSDPGYKYVKALLHLVNRDSKTALDNIQALKRNHMFSPIKEAALTLWEARCLDILGRRQEAVAVYKSLLRTSGLVKQIQKAARKSLRRKYSYSRLPKSIEYVFLGPLEF